METKQDNELIAEFMELPLSMVCDTGHEVLEHPLSYDNYFNEWNNLMPVVEKISEYGNWLLRPGFAMFQNYEGEQKQSKRFKFIKHTGDFEEVNGEPVEWIFIIACVCLDFIKWYNRQKQ